MTDKELIWLCALRYALGRKTYVVSVVCSWLLNHKLSIIMREQIIKDINYAIKSNNLGHDCDKNRWLNLKQVLESQLN